MATAFSPQERERIRDSLLDAALKSAATQGMRHATVDGLAREAGISKGAFYRFYPSKEHLFLSMLERTHEEMYGSAEKVLDERTDLPLRERTMRAILEVFRVAETYNLIPFIREESRPRPARSVRPHAARRAAGGKAHPRRSAAHPARP